MSVTNFKELSEHYGHDIIVAKYGSPDTGAVEIVVECQTCSVVILSYHKPSKNDLIKQKYIKSGGVICPFCGSGDLTGSMFESDDSCAWQYVQCDKCDKGWNDVYNLDDIDSEDLNEEEHETMTKPTKKKPKKTKKTAAPVTATPKEVKDFQKNFMQ